MHQEGFYQVFYWKILKTMNLSQNLTSNVFSAWRSIIHLINVKNPRLRLRKLFGFGQNARVNWGGGGGYLPYIPIIKWNPNDVLTTSKAISKGLASGFVYWSCARRNKTRSSMADGYDSTGSCESLVCVEDSELYPLKLDCTVLQYLLLNKERLMDKRPRILEELCRKLSATTRKVVAAQW